MFSKIFENIIWVCNMPDVVRQPLILHLNLLSVYFVALNQQKIHGIMVNKLWISPANSCALYSM